MVERDAIVEHWRNRRDTSAILATLVRVEGSSYRRPGARMYIHATGYAGAISGGCLEGNVVRKAAWIARNGPAIETYSTLFDEILDDSDAAATREIPYGLGCGGVLDILLEPGTLPETDAMLRALEAAQHGETLYTATVLPSSASGSIPFARVIVRPDDARPNDSIVFSSSHLSMETRSQLASLARMGKHPDTVSIALGNAMQNVFFEPILPPQRLVIFGAGEDARPLARMAHLLGWSVAIADGRPRLAQATRFPEAEQVLVLNEAAANLEQLRLSNRDVVAVLTHSFQQDKNLIRRLLPLELRYLGLLGAHHRSRVLLTEVGQQLGWTPEQCLRRVHTPIGLDLGSDSPETVALAIIAEIQSVIHEKHAAPRRMSEEALHAASERAYIPVQCPLDDAPPPPYASKTTH